MESEAKSANRSRGGARRGAGRRRAQCRLEKSLRLSSNTYGELSNLRDHLHLPSSDAVVRFLLTSMENCR